MTDVKVEEGRLEGKEVNCNTIGELEAMGIWDGYREGVRKKGEGRGESDGRTRGMKTTRAKIRTWARRKKLHSVKHSPQYYLEHVELVVLVALEAFRHCCHSARGFLPEVEQS